MVYPVKQRRPALGSNNVHFFSLTSRSFPVQVTITLVAFKGVNKMNVILRYPSSFRICSVTSGTVHTYSESQLKPSWKHVSDKWA